MRTGIIVGRAAAALDEYDAAQLLGAFDCCLVVGKMAVDFPHPIDHWVTFHAALYDKWSAEREARGHPAPMRYWSAIYRGRKLGEHETSRTLDFVPCIGGSSGYMAVQVALDMLGLQRVVLAGIPMQADAAHYGDARAWDEANFYWATWERNLSTLRGKLRSMSGRTRDALGAPTSTWLAGQEE